MRASVQKHIALLIFALSPEEELQQKGITGEMGLYSLLNQHTLKLAEKLGIPYFHFTEKEQVGNTFGERYIHAIKKLFSRGYEGVITIGNDTPGLTSGHLQTAYSMLQMDRAVLGPSLDGGFYLLAIPKSSFSEQDFSSVSWKTAGVFRQMRRYLEKINGSLCLLDILGDLDDREDIDSILDQKSIIPFGIKMFLIKVRQRVQPFTGNFNLNYNYRTLTRIQNRGSPVLAV